MSTVWSVSGTQVCRNCRRELPVEKFKFRSRTGRQSGQRFTMCNRCLYVRYTRPDAWRKKAIIDAYKVAAGCADCGFNTHPRALEFDHRPGTVKLFNVGEKVGSYALDQVWDEIAKCDVVCANCHVLRTEERYAPVEVPMDALPIGRIPDAVKRRMQGV